MRDIFANVPIIRLPYDAEEDSAHIAIAPKKGGWKRYAGFNIVEGRWTGRAFEIDENFMFEATTFVLANDVEGEIRLDVHTGTGETRMKLVTTAPRAAAA